MAGIADVIEYKWRVRKNNTARLVLQYQGPNGEVIPTTGCDGTLFVYDGAATVLEKSGVNDAPNGRFDILLTVAEILAFDFRQASYEFNVVFPNGDVTTFVQGPLIVESGLGPFE
jgi:hypothetical protein